MLFTNKRFLSFIALGVLAVYIANLFIDIMEIDATQYALISLDMSWTKSFLEVYLRGEDYLDKPPLLFWLSSLSFLTLGVSNLSYKLPSFLVALLGIYSTYQFAKLYYSKPTAYLSAIVLATSQALFLVTNDVRTDTMLMGFTIFSIWKGSSYLKNKNWIDLSLAAIGVGCAMMTKGPIAIVIFAAAIGSHLLLHQNWKAILDPKWLFFLIIIGLVLIPMSYGLYTQFDLHPEKEAYGLKGPSGLRFFYWTQSFGRITGESAWNNNTGFFYFFHTILWDFQPWIFFFIPSLFYKIKTLLTKGIDKHSEYISLGGFILILLALSLSKYKLPHYIFVLFPFASIITANWLIHGLKPTLLKRVTNIQFGVLHIFWLGILAFFFFVFPGKSYFLIGFMILGYFLFWMSFKRLKNLDRLVFTTVTVAISFNLLMALGFYPNLLSYQAGSQAGKYLHQYPENISQLYSYEVGSYSLDFYAQKHSKWLNKEQIPSLNKGDIVYVDANKLKDFTDENINFSTLKVFPNYRVTALKMGFINSKTRMKNINQMALIKINTNK